jgi:hypothetical protein
MEAAKPRASVQGPQNEDIDMSTTGTDLRKVLMVVESERGTLAKLDSLLGCIALAMEYDDEDDGMDMDDGMDKSSYSDVAKIARKMVQKVMDGLDSLNLQRAAAASVDPDVE